MLGGLDAAVCRLWVSLEGL